jgi:hypothetical protein
LGYKKAMQLSPRKKLKAADGLAPPTSPERSPREEIAFSSPQEGSNNNGRKGFESPRFGSSGSPAKPSNVLARVGAFQAKQDASRKLPLGTIQGPSVLPSSKLYQSKLESEINVKSFDSNEVPIMDYLKNKFPTKPSKWPGWYEVLSQLDIDTVNDVRDLTPEVWNGLEISPVLKSGLEALRQPSDYRARTASPALRQLSESLLVTDGKGGRVGDSQKLWQPKSRLPEQFQEAQQRLGKLSPAKKTPTTFLQEPVIRPSQKNSPVKRSLNYEESNALSQQDIFSIDSKEAGEMESPTKLNVDGTNSFNISVSAPALPSSALSSSLSPLASSWFSSSAVSPSSSFSPPALATIDFPVSPRNDTKDGANQSECLNPDGSPAKQTSTRPPQDATLLPETVLETEVFGETPQKFGSPPGTKLALERISPLPLSKGGKPKSKESSTPSPYSFPTKSPKLEKATKSPRSVEKKKSPHLMEKKKSLLSTTKNKLSSSDASAAAVLSSLKTQAEPSKKRKGGKAELGEGFYIVNCIKARRWNKKRQHYEYLSIGRDTGMPITVGNPRAAYSQTWVG